MEGTFLSGGNYPDFPSNVKLPSHMRGIQHTGINFVHSSNLCKYLVTQHGNYNLVCLFVGINHDLSQVTCASCGGFFGEMSN